MFYGDEADAELPITPYSMLEVSEACPNQLEATGVPRSCRLVCHRALVHVPVSVCV